MGFRAIFLLHCGASIFLIIVGIWMHWANSLQSVTHYLEDSRRSNEILVVLSWLPMLLSGWPLLFFGTSQDVANTFIQVAAFAFMYLPLLDSARELLLLWGCYSILVGARLWHLQMTTVSPVGLSFFMQRCFFCIAASFLYLHTRIWLLKRKMMPLTSSCLDECNRRSFNSLDGPGGPDAVASLPVFNVDGDAKLRALLVLQRRQLVKQQLIGQLVWAAHCQVHGLLPSTVLSHILSMVDVPDPSEADSATLGLLDDDYDLLSQVSSIRPTSTARSSVSSVTYLRSILPARLALGPPLSPGSAAHPPVAEEAESPSGSEVPWAVFLTSWAVLGLAIAAEAITSA
ncbi:unnamed protein product [Symbiodinium sp. CCMP2592]|nr:unnamed protein product [Symbiodinium sp. CCMP2592]